MTNEFEGIEFNDYEDMYEEFAEKKDVISKRVRDESINFTILEEKTYTRKSAMRIYFML